MFYTQWFITRLLKPIVSLILVIILVVSYPSTVLAQTNPFQNIWQRILSLSESPQARTQGAPVGGRQKAGAGRGRCPALIPLDKDNEIPLTAFVPAIQKEQPTLSKPDNVSPSKLTYVWGRTIEQYPTFWFYIPYGSEESKTEYGKFVLLDKYKHIIAGPIFVKIPIGNNPSLAKFTLQKENPLEINQEYNWYFSIVCNPLKPSRNPGVTGWIQRVNLPSFSLGNYQYYANKGIWYDTVTRLVESTDPQTLPQQLDWLLLIKFVFRNVEDVSMNDNDLNQIVNQIANFPIQTLTPVQNPQLQR